MTETPPSTPLKTPAAPQPEDVRRKTGWLHFGILAGFLLVGTVGWSVTMRQLGVWTAKRPIAWPEGVTVNGETFQLTSLPERIGPFRMVKDVEAREDMLDTLKIATSLDKRRYDSRTSNWYSNRIYEDTTAPEDSPYRQWMLDIVFYTGGEVTVPHVPDVCILAGGAEPNQRMVLDVPLPGQPEPWKTKAEFAGIFYEPPELAKNPGLSGTVEFVQYYIFSVNGVPESSREKVRLALVNPFKRYVYYAKVQFLPTRPIRDRDQANDKARQFMQAVLPAILRQLPSASYVENYSEDHSVQSPSAER